MKNFLKFSVYIICVYIICVVLGIGIIGSFISLIDFNRPLPKINIITEIGSFWVYEEPKRNNEGCFLLHKDFSDYIYCGKYIIKDEDGQQCWKTGYNMCPGWKDLNHKL